MQTLLLLVWGTPCEGTVVGIGETRGRHRCLEGSQNEVFYSGAIVFQPLRAARKCVLVFYNIGLLSLWLASGAIFAFPKCSLFRLDAKTLGFLCFVSSLLGSSGGRCLVQLFCHFGPSDSSVWGGSCVCWAGRRFHLGIIAYFPKMRTFYTSFVVFGFLKRCLAGGVEPL